MGESEQEKVLVFEDIADFFFDRRQVLSQLVKRSHIRRGLYFWLQPSMLSHFMVKLNHHYQKLSRSYLFTEIEKRIAALKGKTPAPSLVAALATASKEMGEFGSFRGYGPSEGYIFLRGAIAEKDYKQLQISPDEVFISDGANTDISNL